MFLVIVWKTPSIHIIRNFSFYGNNTFIARPISNLNQTAPYLKYNIKKIGFSTDSLFRTKVKDRLKFELLKELVLAHSKKWLQKALK